jgi:predicted nuclease of predicted toxin-antitoxin system
VPRSGFTVAKDTELLDLADREEPIVITADLDFPRLLALSKAHGPGLILGEAVSHE